MKDLRHLPFVALWALFVFTAVMSAQGNPNLAGSWAIERGAAPGGRGAGGISGIPIATTLVIKVSPDDVTMESDTGSTARP